MTTFYLIRHGKTELNKKTCFQGGGIDSPLLSEGIEQAVKLGQYLSKTTFAAAAVSTQKRAMDTANYILTENQYVNDLTVQYYDELKELGFGEREGIEVDIADQQTNYLRQRPDLYNPSEFNGETYDSLIKRGMSMVERLSTDYPDGNVLIVAHGVLLLVLINYLMGEEKRNWRKNGPLENTSVTVIHKEQGNCILETFNDVSYLEEQLP
ncbi:histidine phosphatase family protein [Enterococcus sp. BWT-B8]|uniref:histidine phosphatase family protein n=1 Tax=unclassified Enterococcus TaxID=2608891 RepID=UPI001E64614C|nr:MULTISPECIES: histidine phosphatase family protein [unclassified Enterococcus]MCB5951641.1 histidine phosphatase family protein [Enterococcus sp. BWT-B8]MCB5954733.1 histidine phosphatase family protein [Enterococcus sp. CWB-B31]